ncbi:squalene/phytoene synthase family protein [Dinoroseobacter sp. PD6]|uniref:squalene/phytoene synthase family protein n=1 Tax=Dinoroseobacter sp. PD6 TaxID=3028384 RepID=UPI00237AE3BB|nr:squalene/phytoene synthase family protein [Dinoroseobacter sp. PD6]MDD9715468.1 squalene/phytoene synthase family protein [Dinoroseobacter sp. PD6]
MSLEACAGLVERGDPDRFLATMAAPVPARRVLFPLYAFNIEVSRAPWLTEEPMIAEMRLQWWRDVLEEIRSGAKVRSHEVATPLAEVLDAEAAAVLDRLVAARRWEVYRDPFEDQAAFDAYLEETGAGLVWAAGRALGAEAAAEAVLRGQGWAAALARYLQAVPDLGARGRIPLVDGRAEAVAELARRGLARLAEARGARGMVPVAARPALLAGWQAETILRQAAKAPGLVAAGGLGLSEFAKRARLAWVSATGRW